MRRWIAAILLVGAGGCVALPWELAAAARAKGVGVARAGWSGEGVRFRGLQRGEIAAEEAVIGWDRVARVRGIRVPRSALKRGEGGGGGGIVGLTAIEVEDLRVEDTPLPALSGRVWPERRLSGEGVSVEGDVVHATVPTPLGEVRVDATVGSAGVDVTAACACVLPAPSPDDVALPVAVEARGTWADGAFAGVVQAGEVQAEVVARPEGEGARAEITLGETPIAAVYALFSPWVPEVGRARIGGTVHGTAEVAWPGGIEAIDPEISGFTVEGLVPAGLAEGTFSYRAPGPDGEMRMYTTGEGAPGWVSLHEMGPWLPAAVIAAEDAGFLGHPGYDLAGMRDAAARNDEAGAIVRGGSTLTQQLAKNLFLDGTRSYARKLRELLYAVEMEHELGKSRILELYLNVVELGPGVRGMGAASDLYFLKVPAGLLPEEAAWLASILRFPTTAYERQYRGGRVDESRVGFILENMRGVPDPPRLAAMDREVHLVPPPRTSSPGPR